MSENLNSLLVAIRSLTEDLMHLSIDHLGCSSQEIGDRNTIILAVQEINEQLDSIDNVLDKRA